MDLIVWLVDTVCRIYFWILVAKVVLDWLSIFGIADLRNPMVGQVWRFLWQATTPVLDPIRHLLRRFLGDLGGIDITPIVAIVVLELLCRFIVDSVLLPLSR